MAMTLLHEFDVLSDILQEMPTLAEIPTLEALAELLWGAALRPMTGKGNSIL
jgi:hypothetical protein